MPFTSDISFTLDTICPWTYLAKRRLSIAIDQVHEAHPDCRFNVKYFPYQLYPEASQEGEDKYKWYRQSRYGDSEEKMKMYTTLMKAHGVGVGIDYSFEGTVANTLQAHRVIQHFQEENGFETADKIVSSLYKQFFEEGRHPSSTETLLRATTEAGIPDAKAKPFIEDQDEGLMDVKMLIREQAGNDVDSVPYIIIEGKRRDFTLVGAKEINEYVKTMEQCIKESH